MASNKHKGPLSLQQVLDSVLNDDPEKMYQKKNQVTYILLPHLHQTSHFYLVAIATYLIATPTNDGNVSNNAINKNTQVFKVTIWCLKTSPSHEKCVEFILRFLSQKFSEIFIIFWRNMFYIFWWFYRNYVLSEEVLVSFWMIAYSFLVNFAVKLEFLHIYFFKKICHYEFILATIAVSVATSASFIFVCRPRWKFL